MRGGRIREKRELQPEVESTNTMFVNINSNDFVMHYSCNNNLQSFSVTLAVFVVFEGCNFNFII